MKPPRPLPRGPPPPQVPFSVVLLLDHVKRGTTPEGMRVRMIVPSDGLTSVSLWDLAPTTDAAQLKEWLDNNLGGDGTSEVHGVAEDFTYGVMLEVGRVRAAERVAANTGRTLDTLNEQTSKATAAIGASLRDFDRQTGVITVRVRAWWSGGWVAGRSAMPWVTARSVHPTCAATPSAPTKKQAPGRSCDPATPRRRRGRRLTRWPRR